MSMQSEGKDTKGRNDDQSTRDGAGSAGSGESPAGDTIDQEAGRAFSGSQQSSQQSSQQAGQQDAMPPSQTDDDQYDQGTAQRAP